jgi:hypothetical protein
MSHPVAISFLVRAELTDPSPPKQAEVRRAARRKPQARETPKVLFNIVIALSSMEYIQYTAGDVQWETLLRTLASGVGSFENDLL